MSAPLGVEPYSASPVTVRTVAPSVRSVKVNVPPSENVKPTLAKVKLNWSVFAVKTGRLDTELGRPEVPVMFTSMLPPVRLVLTVPRFWSLHATTDPLPPPQPMVPLAVVAIAGLHIIDAAATATNDPATAERSFRMNLSLDSVISTVKPRSPEGACNAGKQECNAGTETIVLAPVFAQFSLKCF